MNIIPLLIASSLIALSGCAGVGAEATLEYDGSANGTHSDQVDCDDQGKLKGSGNVLDGDVLVTLRDSAGKMLFQQSFQGEFTLDEKTVSGASGDWDFSAERSADDLAGDPFSGKYAFYVNC